jgi:hypothetical protein
VKHQVRTELQPVIKRLLVRQGTRDHPKQLATPKSPQRVGTEFGEKCLSTASHVINTFSYEGLTRFSSEVRVKDSPNIGVHLLYPRNNS